MYSQFKPEASSTFVRAKKSNFIPGKLYHLVVPINDKNPINVGADGYDMRSATETGK